MFDIYGNPLQAGNCEVHPHIPEHYPCAICLQESKEYEMQHMLRQMSNTDQELSLSEKIEQVRNVLGLVGDQYTCNLMGDIQEELEKMLKKITHPEPTE